MIPGKSLPILKIIKKRKLIPKGILITHHHHDHIDGISNIKLHYNIPIYGPKEAQKYGIEKVCKDGDNFTILQQKFFVISLPGHTLGHIGFYKFPFLFSGDTIFSAGCGKTFEGTNKQLYFSLKKITQLPLKTWILCGHDYILENIQFALSILPEDMLIKKFSSQLIKYNFVPIITNLFLEKKINIFLRCHEIFLRKKISKKEYKNEWSFFSLLRKRKDRFNK